MYKHGNLSLRDTIFAVSTPFGIGAISVIRISGRDSLKIVQKIFKGKLTEPRKIAFGTIMDGETPLDQVLVVWFKAPASYTGEDLVEIHCHGNPLITERILELLRKHGARMAKPGEFTKRAFLNGKLDLSQAEAVADLIESKTLQGIEKAVNKLEGSLSKKIKEWKQQLEEIRLQLIASFDFPEEDLELEEKTKIALKVKKIRSEIESMIPAAESEDWVKNGILTVIFGKPNVGKSSLMNALLKRERVIVSNIPGTTRDAVEEPFYVEGMIFRLVDTAGVIKSKSPVEKKSVEKSLEFLEKAHLILFVVDASSPLTGEDLELLKLIKKKRSEKIVVLNKIDLPTKIEKKQLPNWETVEVSALTGEGLLRLIEKMKEIFKRKTVPETNSRETYLLKSAAERLKNFEENLHMSEDVLEIDIREASEYLAEILGENVPISKVDEIFERFCIGK